MIDKFSGDNRFLSNFYAGAVEYDGLEYKCVEHAYQAAKTVDAAMRRRIRECVKPGEAKRLGKQVKMREGWEQMKISVMTELVKQKFTKHAQLREKLLATGEEELIEGNTWGDTFWGVCKGAGRNELGKILMEVRKDLSK